MKEIKRITAFVLVLVLLATALTFAGSASIVSPQANMVSTSDSLLVSVKLTEPGTIRIKFIEKKLRHVDILSTGSAVDGTYSTYEAISYEAVDTADITADDLTTPAAFDKYYDKSFAKSETYTSKENIGFYTKQITNVKPGLYKIVVESLDEEGEAIDQTESYIAVKAKTESQQIFEQKQSGALKVLQNLLKSLFK